MDNYTEEQERTYRALQIAAERIGQNNYQSGLYRVTQIGHSKHNIIGYRITEEHKAIIEAMPKVLAGTMSCESAMALLHTYGAMEQRFPKSK